MSQTESFLTQEDERKASIIRTSILGIVANVALAGFKAAVGLLSHSIAITLDAVNNLSDAASSAITILGTKLAGKPADHNHPYGHGRYEYLTTMVVSIIVLWAGLSSLVEAIKGILDPQTPDYHVVGLVIVGVAVIVKLALGTYFQGAGKRLESDTLVASGKDASFDAIISASTLVAAVLYVLAGISVEAWLGAAISIVIVKSGVEMLREALGKVLGARVDDELARDIKSTVCGVEGVRGAYDLILNDYGPQRLQGSVHIEVDESITAREVDRITRTIQMRVMRDHSVVLHTIGIYSTNTSENSAAQAIHAALEAIVEAEPYVLQVHGLYVDSELKGATFDLVVSFEAPDREAVRTRVVQQMSEQFPGYAFVAVLDSDISD